MGTLRLGHRSISYASTLGVPIYIMENGIPGGPDDPKRKDWIVGCLNTACTSAAQRRSLRQ